MLFDFMVGKHPSILLEEEKRVDTVSARPENKAERKRVPQLFELSDYLVVSLLFGTGFSRILGDRRLKRKVRDGTRSTMLSQ
jgi:hypothetical protein